MVWDDESIKQLIKLWDKGLSTTEIAKKMNVSKNSVVGKVHRLCLKARPSPIKKKNVEAENVETENNLSVQPQEQAETKTESKKSKTVTEKKQPDGEKINKKDEKKASEKVSTSETTQTETKVSCKNKSDNKVVGNIKLVELDSHTCRWPIGDPRDEDFCFCGKKVRAGQTYCDEHSQVAYVKATAKR